MQIPQGALSNKRLEKMKNKGKQNVWMNEPTVCNFKKIGRMRMCSYTVLREVSRHYCLENLH